MDERAFAHLVARVGEFHITDRTMKRAQSEAEGMARSAEFDAGKASRYAQLVRAYFSGFEKEARVHLRDVDRRLEHANQVHFNLTAERGVALKRIEATASVLSDLSAIEETSP